MANCKNCDSPIIWKVPYVKGDGPLNPDNTPHRCKKSEQKRFGNESTPTINVTWPTLGEDDKTPDMQELQDGSRVFTALAVEDVLERVPDIDRNGNLFGQMVNAEKTHLINLALVRAFKK